MVSLIALSGLVHYLFLSLSWAKQFDRALVPGGIAIVAWFITAVSWFAETIGTNAVPGSPIWPVAFLWGGLGVVAGVQFLIVAFRMMGQSVIIQPEEEY